MSELPDVQQNNEQILNDIQSLQQMEQQLFDNLDSHPNLSSEQKEQIIENINNISSMRINLYQTLGGVNEFFHNALSSSIGTLKEQTSAIALVENELNRAKKRLEIFEAERNNKIRLVEINEYYGDKYSEYTKLMKIIIFTLVPVLILTVLNSKGFLPNMVYYVLFGIVAIIGSVYMWKCLGSIIMRDNMNYQEYNWYFDIKSAPTGGNPNGATDPWADKKKNYLCVGDECCSPDQTFDISLNKCIDKPCSSNNTSSSSSNTNVEPFLTETMVNNVLTRSQGEKYNSDVSLRSHYDSAYNMNV